jgi:hypothetical protein
MQPPDENSLSGAAEDIRTRTEQYAREEPMQALGVAFLAGLLLTLLPVGSLIALILRLTLNLVRPLLVILGAVKLYEEISSRQKR